MVHWNSKRERMKKFSAFSLTLSKSACLRTLSSKESELYTNKELNTANYDCNAFVVFERYQYNEINIMQFNFIKI
jgi:hypothetical protein